MEGHGAEQVWKARCGCVVACRALVSTAHRAGRGGCLLLHPSSLPSVTHSLTRVLNLSIVTASQLHSETTLLYTVAYNLYHCHTHFISRSPSSSSVSQSVTSVSAAQSGQSLYIAIACHSVSHSLSTYSPSFIFCSFSSISSPSLSTRLSILFPFHFLLFPSLPFSFHSFPFSKSTNQYLFNHSLTRYPISHSLTHSFCAVK